MTKMLNTNPQDSFKKVECTIHEKPCPHCGQMAQVEPSLGWEVEFHWIRDWRGRTVKCPGTGQRVPQGTARTRILMLLKGNKNE